MNKYEQYADEIRELKNNKFYTDFVKPYLKEADNEKEMEANFCAIYTELELMEKHTKPNRNEEE